MSEERNCPSCGEALAENPANGLVGVRRCLKCGQEVPREPGEAGGAGTGLGETLAEGLVGRALGGYVLGEPIGVGSRGAVFYGEPVHPGPEAAPAAVKVVAHDRSRAPVQDRMIEWARAAVGARHPSLAALLAVGADAGLGVAFLVSELAPGEDLARRVTMSGPVDALEAARIGSGLAEALGCLHEAGALHRDVRPSHVVAGPDGRARLVEAGFAPVMMTARGYGETGPEPVVGTPDYLSPEQARDVAKATPASDLYALGATLFHLIAGRPPFVARSALGMLVQHASRPAPPLRSLAPGTPPDIARIVDGLLAKDPAARPKAAEVARALAEASGARGAAVPAAFLRGRLRREEMLAACLLERRILSRDELESALGTMASSPGRSLPEVLAESGVAREAMGRVEHEVELAEKRRSDAAFGKLAMELGFARLADIERILEETNRTWRTLGEAMVAAGILSREKAETLAASCARRLREEDSVALEAIVRERLDRGPGPPAGGVDSPAAEPPGGPGSAAAVARARQRLGDLPPEDDRSLLDLLLEAGAIEEATAQEVAAEIVRCSLMRSRSGSRRLPRRS